MPVSYTLDFNNTLIRAEAHGVVTTSQIIQYVESLMKDDRIPFGATEVFSMATATDLKMAYSELGPFSDLFQRYKERIGTTILVYAPTDLSFGLFRMLVSSLSAADPEATEAFVFIRNPQELKKILLASGFN